MKNKFYEKFHDKSNFELEEIILNEKKYQKNAVSLAKEILITRKKKPLKQSEKKIIEFSPKKNRYEFKYSLEPKILAILLIIILQFGIQSYSNQSEYYLILFLLTLVIIIFNRNVFFKNKPIVVIDQKGIWTSSHGYTDWSKIERIVLKDKGIMRYLTRFYLDDELWVYLKNNTKKEEINFSIISGISNKKLLDQLIKYYMKKNNVVQHRA
jgi:hypothetical protein